MVLSNIPLQVLSFPETTPPSNPFDDEHRQDPFVVADSSDDECGCDDASSTISRSSTVSKSSTIEYDQECFSSFQHKATQLAFDIFPGHDASCIQVERMAGGAFNRIIGITISTPQAIPSPAIMRKYRRMPCGNARSKPKSRKSDHYILRVPRSTKHSLLHQATTLLYLKKRFPCPTPQLHTYNSDSDNALGRPYMLQERLPCSTLTTLWPSLNQDQRKSAATCIAEVVRDMQDLTSKTAGILSARNTSYDLKQNLLRIEPIPIPPTNINMNTPLAKPQTTCALLLELCQRQRDHTRAEGLANLEYIWDGFVQMTEDLYARGLIPDKDVFHFYHADMQSRNLLFAIESPTTIRLTGILDWDYALFAPKFMSMCAPFFLWSEDDADENEEGDAVVELEDREKGELKRIFEHVVGRDLHQESYRQEYVLARRMWYFLVNGLRNGGDVFLAEEVLELWGEMDVSGG